MSMYVDKKLLRKAQKVRDENNQKVFTTLRRGDHDIQFVGWKIDMTGWAKGERKV